MVTLLQHSHSDEAIVKSQLLVSSVSRGFFAGTGFDSASQHLGVHDDVMGRKGRGATLLCALLVDGA